ncbi:MAG: acyl-CoA carboxylase epsilon subunit [Cellulomonas sp.]
MTEESSGGPALEPALVHIVRGEPDDVELAALVAGLAAAGGDESDDPAAPSHSAWSGRTFAMGTRLGSGNPTARGADAWRWSLRG